MAPSAQLADSPPAGDDNEDMKGRPSKVQDHAEAVASRLVETLLAPNRMEKIRPAPPRTHLTLLQDVAGDRVRGEA